MDEGCGRATGPKSEMTSFRDSAGILLRISFFQVARKYEVRLALDGANSGVHFTGKVFPIDVPNDEVVGLKHEILSFTTAQALQSRRSDGNGAHFIRLSYAVTKRCVG